MSNLHKIHVKNLPRVKWYFGNGWSMYDCYLMAVMWDRNPNARLGEYLYHKSIVIRFKYPISFTWRNTK